MTRVFIMLLLLGGLLWPTVSQCRVEAVLALGTAGGPSWGSRGDREAIADLAHWLTVVSWDATLGCRGRGLVAHPARERGSSCLVPNNRGYRLQERIGYR